MGCSAQAPGPAFSKKRWLRACLDPSSIMYVHASRRQAGRQYRGNKKPHSASTECGIVSKPLDKTIFYPYIGRAKTIFYCEGSEPRTQFSSKEGDGREPFAFVLESRFCFYVLNYTTPCAVCQGRTQTTTQCYHMVRRCVWCLSAAGEQSQPIEGVSDPSQIFRGSWSLWGATTTLPLVISVQCSKQNRKRIQKQIRFFLLFEKKMSPSAGVSTYSG